MKKNNRFYKLSNFGMLGKIVIGLSLGVSISLNLWQWQKNKSNEAGNIGSVRVEAVIDGDTLVLDGDVRLRLRSIDAPELENCGGREAKEELEKSVGGKTVRIKEQIIDKWGRPMALIYVDNDLINEKLVGLGLARFHNDTTTETERLKAAYNKARRGGLGIWSEKCQQKENKKNPKCDIKGNIDDNARDRKLYYYPGCAQYKFTVVELDMGEQWFCDKTEAEKAGFVKSKTCPN